MSTISIQHHYGNNPLCICDDCRKHTWFKRLNPIKDVEERLMAGCETPAGECPKCGALAYVVSDHDAECRRFKVELMEFLEDKK